jgi:RHH-type proline utilization regulon transcriptional repressor/proline dehydrogenase/delta 1-pyrroline-5-carboxylate dehydrogenase
VITHYLPTSRRRTGVLVPEPRPEANTLRQALRADHRADETAHLAKLVPCATLDEPARKRAAGRARDLVAHIRAQRRKVGNIDALMQEYDLSSAEGVTLMCLAEALLRIPDARTQDEFIEDRLGRGDWAAHLGASESFFVNASTFGLMVAGRTVSVDGDAGPAVDRVVKRLGEPVIRLAVRRAMRVLGRQFVMGRTIEEALARAAPAEAKGYRHSYDMLGEAARTAADAARYFEAYARAIRAAGEASGGRGPVEGPGVSVKLSALHPRYEYAQADRVMTELRDRLVALAEIAAAEGVGLTIDAEEADRLEPSLDLLEAIAGLPSLRAWPGLGLAVQAYQKRAFALVDWLEELARAGRRRLLVRLVKGAYWDTEIKRAQERGYPGYPVLTRKTHTDVSYLACARKLLDAQPAFYPCFATHNATTLAALIEMAGRRRDLELQRLHGMGEALYQRVVEDDALGIACRVYAPVGGHEDLLAYLVRRLLENGANTSFVNRITDDTLPIEDIVKDPVAAAGEGGFTPHPKIPLPKDLYGPSRRNSAGLDLADPATLAALKPAMEAGDHDGWRAAPIIGGKVRAGALRMVWSPADRTRKVGEVAEATAEDARDALAAAARAAESWNAVPAGERAGVLRVASDLIEAQAPALMALIVREAGRSVADAHLEVREAVDYLRYYAAEAERLFAAPQRLPGPTGEENTLALAGRGPFLAIAPWNFPLAIFAGQVAGALAAGCPALAKPAEQTPLIAAEAVRILHEAGVPADALHLLPGDGPALAEALLPDPRLAGVVFTGSIAAAQSINRALAQREGPIIPLIAETGGVNAMIADSTALPEQVTRDVLSSAFQSAGQRCSALRLLCLQEEIADRQLEMIAGAMAELRVGDPALLATDVGPIIDEEALAMLEAHKADMAARFRTIAEAPRGEASGDGLYFPPVAFEIGAVEDLTKEVFGPILHVVRWRAGRLDELIDRINALRYGLTLSLHSRSESRIAHVAGRARVGNIYVNRNQIGAVVGVQPFGGEGLSGTGPKAGGPHYLARFAVERALTVDTTAQGGDARLLGLGG